ncbi:MAG: hypothetical protein Q4P72_06950, partial [Eubacteriales bacterium]|nr:hypothetical protein [Eubacteriales bacterium]
MDSVQVRKIDAQKYLVATVFIQNAQFAFDRNYDYLVPEAIRDEICLGQRVLLPFGRQNTPRRAFVHRLEYRSEIASNLKSIDAISDPMPWFDAELLALVETLAIRYACPRGRLAQHMLPPIHLISDKRDTWIQLVNREEAQLLYDNSSFTSLQQMTVVENLLTYSHGLRRSDLLSLADCSASVLGTLEKKAIIRQVKELTPAQIRELEDTDLSDLNDLEITEDLRLPKHLSPGQSSVLSGLLLMYETVKQRRNVQALRNESEAKETIALLRGV